MELLVDVTVDSDGEYSIDVAGARTIRQTVQDVQRARHFRRIMGHGGLRGDAGEWHGGLMRARDKQPDRAENGHRSAVK